jgi:hypothetical protein
MRASGAFQLVIEPETDTRPMRATVVLMDARPDELDAAADDLNAAAIGLVHTTAAEGASSLVRRQRLLREAFQRFQQRLASAKPSVKAQRMGLG